MSKPPMTVSLTWDHALEFTGEAGKHEVGIDGASYTAPSPMVLLAMSLAGCMAIDLVHILTRGRHTVHSLSTTLTVRRAADEFMSAILVSDEARRAEGGDELTACGKEKTKT